MFEVWCEFDYNYGRPLLVYNFPKSLKMHDDLTKNINEKLKINHSKEEL
jgi:hypothetical protein